jgi:hypothetical protein
VSRLLFCASFFGFIIPGWESDILAIIAVIAGFIVTPHALRQILGLFVSSSVPKQISG